MTRTDCDITQWTLQPLRAKEVGKRSCEDICIPCGYGLYRNSTMTECRQCPPGMMQEEDEAASCALCEPGFYQSAAGSSECIECDIDEFSENPGSTSCKSCPPGSSNFIEEWLMYKSGGRDLNVVFNSSSDCLCAEACRSSRPCVWAGAWLMGAGLCGPPHRVLEVDGVHVRGFTRVFFHRRLVCSCGCRDITQTSAVTVERALSLQAAATVIRRRFGLWPNILRKILRQTFSPAKNV
jgi:hypothetical protein